MTVVVVVVRHLLPAPDVQEMSTGTHPSSLRKRGMTLYSGIVGIVVIEVVGKLLKKLRSYYCNRKELFCRVS